MMQEQCILVDSNDNQIGAGSKLQTHRGDGLRHRAFSVLIFDSQDRLLLQKRSSDKITFPGVWANSCCSHPLNVKGENEGLEGVKNAAIRKMDQELGIPVGTVSKDSLIFMTKMEYFARADSEWVEHEIDHIMICRADVETAPNSNEISETRWVSRDELQNMVEAASQGELIIAPWFDLIRKNLLHDWWDNLDLITEMGDEKIHRFKEDEETVLDTMTEHRLKVEQRIDAALAKTGEARLRGAMGHLFLGGGKRLRAVLPSLVAEAIGNHDDGLYDLGAAIEIIHNFTLVHDDIMDDDSIRRGRPAVHVEFDLPTAINAGDAMLAVAFEILAESATIEEHLFRPLVKTVGEMVRRVSEGQQMDMDFENSETVTESDYIEMISGKTAAMFETCAKTGAMLGGANSEIMEICRQWGLEVGLCFQLMDDLIDVTGDTKTLGKPACSDIIDGKRTLIAIHALAENATTLPNFTEYYSSRNTAVSRDILDIIVAELENSGSIQHARQRAMQHHANAHILLDKLPSTSHLAVLRELTDWQLNRIA
jgi:geranylgeranyl diphosphate synthase type I